MLKIKDDVDLKELEVYGFLLMGGIYTKNICDGRRGQRFELSIGNNRELLGYSVGADGDGEEAPIDDTLYRLIKDGLVEMVED